MRSPLRDLVSALPQAEAIFSVAAEAESQGIYGAVHPEEPYVWPNLDSAADWSSTSLVVLISAPGAMGKSYAARHVAHESHALYIDLAQLRVGNGSLTGELTKALGFDQIGPFVAELKAGRASLVIDSTDEALLRAGRENYMAFLGDLWWLMHDASPANGVIMFGRPDATDTTEGGLSRLGLSVSKLSIAPLDRAQATELIDLTLDRRKNGRAFYEVHRRHSEPFGVLRDAVFRNIANALSPSTDNEDWAANENFLGYPPVLLALAERLAVDNPAEALLEEVNEGARGERGQLLRSIVEYILNREQNKVRELAGDALGLAKKAPERSVLYSQDEQISRLLDLTGTKGVTLEAPAVLDDADRQKYEDSITGFLIDHPFLRDDVFSNVVFADYARAWAVSSPVTELFAANRAEFLGTLPDSGPFFAYFLHALSSDVDEWGVLPEDLVDDAMKSFASGVVRSAAFYTHTEERALLLLSDESQDSHPTLGFRITELSGVLTLRSPLVRTTVISQHALIVLPAEGGIDIGPSVTLIAGEIDLVGKSLTAFGEESSERRDDGALSSLLLPPFNMISAGTVVHEGDFRVSAIPPKDLIIYWPDAWHQWKPFYTEFMVPGVRLTPGTTSQVLMCLRRLLTSFKSSVRADPSISAEKMDRLLVGDNPVFQATRSALSSLGVIERDGGLFRLHLSQLGEYGFSYSDLRGDDPIEPLQRLLDAVVGQPDFDPFRTDKKRDGA